MSAPDMPELGSVFETPWPFCRTTFEHYGADLDDPPDIEESWRPGVEIDHDNSSDWNGPSWHADAMGLMVCTVVGHGLLMKPRKNRVFYVRQWVDPDGRKFGKTIVRVLSADGFRRMVAGYRGSFSLGEVKP